jgi:hypothetical protein
VDEWLAAHPDHPALPHLEDLPGSAIEGERAQASAAIDATDPGAIEPDADEEAAEAAADEPATAG